MPIYYSQNYIHKTQTKLKKYMRKIQNCYLRDCIKYNYIKKFYQTLKTKKSMISSSKLQEDIINFIHNNKEMHKRFVTINTSLIQTITEIGEAVYNNINNNNSSESDSDNNNSSESDESNESSDSSEY